MCIFVLAHPRRAVIQQQCFLLVMNKRSVKNTGAKKNCVYIKRIVWFVHSRWIQTTVNIIATIMYTRDVIYTIKNLTP